MWVEGYDPEGRDGVQGVIGSHDDRLEIPSNEMVSKV